MSLSKHRTQFSIIKQCKASQPATNISLIQVTRREEGYNPSHNYSHTLGHQLCPNMGSIKHRKLLMVTTMAVITTSDTISTPHINKVRSILITTTMVHITTPDKDTHLIIEEDLDIEVNM